MENKQRQMDDISDPVSQPFDPTDSKDYGTIRTVAAPTSKEAVSSASGASTQVSTPASGSILLTDYWESLPSSLRNQHLGARNRILHQHNIGGRDIDNIHFPRPPIPAVLRPLSPRPSPLGLHPPQTNQHVSHPTTVALKPHQPNGILSARLSSRRSLTNQSQPQSSSPRNEAGLKKIPAAEEENSRFERFRPAAGQTESRTAIDISRHISLSDSEESDGIQIYKEKDDLSKVTEHELVEGESGLGD